MINKFSRYTQTRECFEGKEEGGKSHLNIYDFIMKLSVQSLLGWFLPLEFEKQSLALIDLVMYSILSGEMMATIHLINAESLLTRITQRIQMNGFFHCFKQLDCAHSQLHWSLNTELFVAGNSFLLKKVSENTLANLTPLGFQQLVISTMLLTY